MIDVDRRPTASPRSSAEIKGLIEGVHAGPIGRIHRMQRLDGDRTPAARHGGSIAARPSRTISRAAAISFDPAGRPPTTSTRQSASSAAASSTARRLSSTAAPAPAAVGAGKMPPRQSPVTRSPLLAHELRRLLEPDRRDLVAPGRDGGDAVPQAALDRLRDAPLRATVARLIDSPSTGSSRPHASPAAPRIRAAARTGSRSNRALSASRKSSVRCNSERALCCPPTIRKWSDGR